MRRDLHRAPICVMTEYSYANTRARSALMPPLPPLDCLRFFEIAARRESFARAAEELNVTSAAVAYRIKTLEDHLGHSLFDRLRRRGVRLNRRGKDYLSEIRRVLADLEAVTDAHCDREVARTIRMVSVESLAERWLMPRLPAFRACHPDIAFEIETNHRGVDPDRRDFDVWLAYAGPTAAPRPRTLSGAEALLEDTLFEETLAPVCSPALIAARGLPRAPAELHGWPLLYDLGWESDWPNWFARRGVKAPGLSRASGFRLYSMVIHAAVEGLGAAIGRPSVIARELEDGRLVPLFDSGEGIPERCCLITTDAARRRPEVQAFREWILLEAAQAHQAAPAAPIC